MTLERKIRTFPVLAGAVAALAILFGHVAPAAETGSPQMRTVPPPASDGSEAPPGPGAIVVPATVQAFFATDLYAKDSGYISQINSDIGDHVKKGQLLAVIENPELQAQFDRAQAA